MNLHTQSNHKCTNYFYTIKKIEIGWKKVSFLKENRVQHQITPYLVQFLF